LNHDRPPDQVGVLQHHRDGFPFRFRQRPFLEDRASRAHEVQEPLGVDVLLEKLTRRRFLVDVDLMNVDAGRIQKTSGIFAGRSRGLRVERRLRHRDKIIEIADFRVQISA
jgi:hypothetical protein